QCGRRTRPGEKAAGDPCRDARHGRRGSFYHDGRGRSGSRARGRDAHHGTDARYSARGQVAARRDLRTDDAERQKRNVENIGHTVLCVAKSTPSVSLERHFGNARKQRFSPPTALPPLKFYTYL